MKKLNYAVSVGTNQNAQNKLIENLASIKHYYSELTKFLLQKQTSNRFDELELVFTQELSDYLEFWQKVMDDFKLLTQQEFEKVIETNQALKKEFNELIEKTMGFTPPPNSLFLQLSHIRKIAQKVKQ